jgi:hypothetical protein
MIVSLKRFRWEVLIMVIQMLERRKKREEDEVRLSEDELDVEEEYILACHECDCTDMEIIMDGEEWTEYVYVRCARCLAIMLMNDGHEEV